MNSIFSNDISLRENVIIADADYIDKVAFDLIVNFERMIGRRIPPADMTRWTECVALDGGIREGDNSVQVFLIHDRSRAALDNFTPSNYADSLDGKAFRSHLGEFLFSALTVENIVSKEDFFTDVLSVVSNHKDVRRVMAVPDDGKYYDTVRHTLRRVPEDKHITVFSMQPMQGGNYRQEILGYSLMNALGIRADEIDRCK